MQRRTFLQALGAIPLAGCFADPLRPPDQDDVRLLARPDASTALTLAPGETAATVDGTEFIAYLPESAAGLPEIPLLVFLHGAGRNVEGLLTAMKPLADHARVMLLFPHSRLRTWDAINDRFGPDRAGIDRALAWTFARAPIAPARVVLAGFSDGATYALGIGRANGDLFGKLIAFAPGMLLETVPVGRPPIVVVHGTQDPVLPYATSQAVIVPTLRAKGHAVDFLSFEGPHVVPLFVLTEQVDLLGGVEPAP